MNEKTYEIYSSELKVSQILDQLSYATELAKSKKLYKKSKLRYAALAAQLQECADMASKLAEIPVKVEQPTLSSKDIMKIYAERFAQLDNMQCGIIEVNACIRLLVRWFNARYFNSVKNPKFLYKADRINEWIDAIIISYAKAMHECSTPEFISDTYSWIDSLSTDMAQIWPIPLYIKNSSNDSDISSYYSECIVLETIIKKLLYDSYFFPTYKKSVEKIVISKGIQPGSIIELIQDCNLTKTSSFNIDDYKE